MNKQAWRVDSIGRGQIAWLYVIPHACEWSDVAATVGQNYEITEEAQNLVDINSAVASGTWPSSLTSATTTGR